MSKKGFILSVLFIISTISHSYSQAIDKVKLGSFAFSAYPTTPIPLGYKLYAVVDGNNLSYSKTSNINKHIFLHNRQRVTSAEAADITIQIADPTVNLYPSIVFPIPQRRNDPSIPVTYKAQQRKEISYVVTVSDSSQIIYQNNVWIVEEKESRISKTPEKAQQGVAKLLQAYTIEKELDKTNKIINHILGTYNISVIKLFIYGAKNTKKSTFDYDSLNYAAKLFTDHLHILKTDEFDKQRFCNSTSLCEQIWKKELEDCNDAETDRLTEEMVASLHYNLGTYYVFIKEFDKALDELETCEKIYKGFSNAKELSVQIRGLRNRQRNYERLFDTSTPNIFPSKE